MLALHRSGVIQYAVAPWLFVGKAHRKAATFFFFFFFFFLVEPLRVAHEPLFFARHSLGCVWQIHSPP